MSVNRGKIYTFSIIDMTLRIHAHDTGALAMVGVLFAALILFSTEGGVYGT